MCSFHCILKAEERSFETPNSGEVQVTIPLPWELGVHGSRESLKLISGDVYGKPIGVVCDAAKNQNSEMQDPVFHRGLVTSKAVRSLIHSFTFLSTTLSL